MSGTFDARLRNPRAKAKGRRPYFFEDPSVDKLLSIAMALAGELAVARERQDTVERLLAEKNILTAAEIDAWRPDEQAKRERNEWRSDYISRVLMIIQNEMETLDQQRTDAEYDGVVQELAKTS